MRKEEKVRIYCSFSKQLTEGKSFRIYVMNLNKELVKEFSIQDDGLVNYTSYKDGEWLLSWDGKDSKGYKVGAGIYYIVKEEAGPRPECGFEIKPITVIYK